MQRKSNAEIAPEHATAETALARCLVDGDTATKARDLRRRRKALGISFAMEAVVLAWLIAAPLMTSVAQPHFAGTEFVRFVFGGSSNHTRANQQQSGIHHSPTLGDHRIKFTTTQAPPRPLQPQRGETTLPTPLRIRQSICLIRVDP